MKRRSVRRKAIDIRNETHYRGDDLRRFIRAAMTEAGLDDGSPCIVYIDYAKQTGVRTAGGATFYGSAWSPKRGVVRRWRLSLPPKLENLSPAQIKMAAQIATHELDHTKGLSHRDMAKWWTMPVVWSEGLQVRARKPKTKSGAAISVSPPAPGEPTLEMMRAAREVFRCEEELEYIRLGFERSVKRWTKKLDKAKRSERYYERKNERKMRSER